MTDYLNYQWSIGTITLTKKIKVATAVLSHSLLLKTQYLHENELCRTEDSFYIEPV